MYLKRRRPGWSEPQPLLTTHNLIGGCTVSTTSNTVPASTALNAISQWLMDQGIDHELTSSEITVRDLIDPDDYYLVIEEDDDLILVNLCTPQDEVYGVPAEAR